MKRFILICLWMVTFVTFGMAMVEKKQSKELQKETQTNITSNRDTQITEIKPKEKRKVLILQIIEENWDNLEFIPPKIDRLGPYKPPTKREVMERRKKERGILETKDFALKSIKHSMSEGYIPKDAKLCVYHLIKYFGKIEEFNENEIFEEDRYRFGGWNFSYGYKNIPPKISLLTEPKFINLENLTKISPLSTLWDRFEHIRLVEEINILSSDNLGNLKIKHDNKTYNLRVGNRIIFPVKEANLSQEEMVNFKKKYKEERSVSSLRSLSVKKEIFYFKTRVTIINHGYVEVEL